MFVLIWAALLFSVRSNHADTGVLKVAGAACDDKGYCISPTVEITSEAGLCVILPCNFTTADSFTVKSIIWYKCDQSNTKCDSDIIFDSSDKNKTGRVSLLEPDLSKRNCSIIINHLPESDSGSYQLRVKGTLDGNQTGYTFPSNTAISITVEQHGTRVTCKFGTTDNNTTEETMTLNKTYIKITGNTTVKEGDALNLTCSVEGFSPSVITWTKPDTNKKHKGTKTDPQNNIGTNWMNDTTAKPKDDTEAKGVTDMQNKTVTDMQNKTVTDTQNKTGTDTQNKTVTDTQNKTVTHMQNNTTTSTLFISNMTSEDSGRYICTAKHLITTLTIYADVTVTWYPKILNNSGCEKYSHSKVVTCVCTSQGVPLPAITWPLLETHTEYTVFTTVSKHTVNSIITVTDHSNTTIKCVSSNAINKAEENFKINELEQDDQLWKLLGIVKQPQVITAFFIGILLSTIICCLARKCHRKKQKSSGNLTEILEMETMQAVSLIDAGQAVEDDGTHNQEAAEGGAEAAGQWNVAPKEVEYSNINFSMLKRKSPEEEIQDATETEYAEIKREETEERQANGEEEAEMLDGNEEEEEVVIEVDKDK